MKNFITLSVGLLLMIISLGISSCKKEVKPILSHSQTEASSGKGDDDITLKSLTSCSFNYAGQSMSWSSGNTALASNQSTDKKYTWRISSSIMNANLGTKLQFKIKINQAYPIVVRVVAQNGSTFTTYYGCTDLTSSGQEKSYDFWVPTSGNPGALVPTYDNFDFEVIVLNRNFTGNPSVLIPVTITVCKHGGGGC